ncbi:MNNG and nitrosoguanidine resistance protein [Nemania sp. FL0031]|nr:MNNG and nitrosoguanidine resistance protein [Nemania sp. FL0031]
MQDRPHPPPDVSRLLIAGRRNGSVSTAGRSRPSRYRRPSYQSSYSQPSQGDSSTRHMFNPHDYDSVNEYNPRDYGRVLGEGLYEQPHQSVGFWHPKMGKVRQHVLKLWVRTIVILMAFVFAALSLYWGVFYNVENNLRALEVHVVDMDSQVPPYNNVTALVGPAFTSLTRQIHSASLHQSLGYRIIPPGEYNYSPANVRRGVYNWDAWAAIVINPNATTMLLNAVRSGDASYDPTGAVQYIVQTARQETTTYNYILPQLQILTSQFTTQFGSNWTKMLLTNNSFSPVVLAQAPAAVNPAVVPLMIDLRPFAPLTATPTVSIGLIYLIIVAFFSFSFFLPIHNKYVQPKGHPPLHFWQLIIWRWLATVTLYLFISLTYSLVSLAFGVPFWQPPGSATEVAVSATAYGRGSFIVYWLINFFGMIALGVACENAAMVLGTPWTALWLIFWVITNVSTSFYSIELAPSFYGWGRAWPLHNVVQASRHIIFDLKSEIGLNFGVLFAWCVINTALFPLCCYFMRWRTEHEERVKLKERDRYVVCTPEGEREFLKKEGDKQPKVRRGFMRGI